MAKADKLVGSIVARRFAIERVAGSGGMGTVYLAADRVRGGHVARVSLVPMTRDEENNVMMLDPSSAEGATLREKVKSLSGRVALEVKGREIVLIP